MFGTSGVRGRFGDEVTAELALSIGNALAIDGAESVVIGRDPRLTGELLVDALAAGIRECGGDVVDIGVAGTPTIARSVGWQDADAGVSVTASHNPPTDNGIKLWSPSGMAFDADRRARITDLVETDRYEPTAWDSVGERRSWDGAVDRHVRAIEKAIGSDDLDLTVVVDVGNGAGRATVEALRSIGCSVETLNERPDGRFPSRPSEPTPEHCRTLRETVAATDADLGIAHDGDADRMLAVEESGSFLGGDVLLALFGREAASSGDRIAAPINTSLAVDDALAAVGAAVDRTPVGDVFVAERARSAEVVFGGEPSGAWIWPDETLCPDGTLAAARLAELVARKGPLSEHAASIEGYPIRRESTPVEEKRAVVAAVEELLQERYDDVSLVDGVRVDTGDGWFLVRASGTEPVVRSTAEARSADRADELLAEANDVIDLAIDRTRRS